MSLLQFFAGAAGLTIVWTLFNFCIRTVNAIKLGIPGPLICKLTSWKLRSCEMRGTRVEFIESMHQRYGDVVMVAPQEIAIRSADAVRKVYMVGKLDKPDSATVLLEQFGEKNLVTTKEVAMHSRRRKAVAVAYTAPTITSEKSQMMFRELVNRFSGQIDKETSENDGRCNIYVLLRLLAVDIMTNVVFGSADSLNSLEVSEHRNIVRMILTPVEQTAMTLGILLMTWYPHFMRAFMNSPFCPMWMKGFADERAGLHGYVLENVEKRLGKPQEEKPDTGTIPSHLDLLVNNYQQPGFDQVIPNATYIASDSLDHVFAGSLTSADTMSWMIWEMCRPENHPRRSRLRQELHDAGIMPGTDVVLSEVNKLPFLYNVVRETLRLHPPIPFSEPRLVKPGQELMVDGYHVPAGMVIGAQHTSIHRRPTAYVDPEVWNPERWEIPIESDQGREMQRHYWPFSSGQRMCIGMHIAMAEIRLVAARIFSTYDVSFTKDWLDGDGKLLVEAQRSHLFPRTNLEPIHFKKLD